MREHPKLLLNNKDARIEIDEDIANIGEVTTFKVVVEEEVIATVNDFVAALMLLVKVPLCVQHSLPRETFRHIYIFSKIYF